MVDFLASSSKIQGLISRTAHLPKVIYIYFLEEVINPAQKILILGFLSSLCSFHPPSLHVVSHRSSSLLVPWLIMLPPATGSLHMQFPLPGMPCSTVDPRNSFLAIAISSKVSSMMEGYSVV